MYGYGLCKLEEGKRVRVVEKGVCGLKVVRLVCW